MLSCFYVFVAVVKVCRREQLSCLFQSVEESGQINEALEMKTPTKCQIWQSSEMSYITMQDSYFVVGNDFDKERLKKIVSN